jgi:hypothetical protein
MCLFTRFSVDFLFEPLCLLRSRFLETSPQRAQGLHREKPQKRSLIRDHSPHFWRVRVADQRRCSQVLLALLLLRGQDVAQKRLRALHLSSASLLEALGGAFVCL